MATSGLCPLCGRHEESTLHILRDCDLVQVVWNKCLGGAIVQGFFSDDLITWLKKNLTNTSLDVWGSKWSLVFGNLLWQIWHFRNKHGFDNCPFLSDAVINTSVYHIRSWEQVQQGIATGHIRYREQLIGWSFPPNGWVKANADGSVNSNSAMATCGGVFRDDTGRWILGFARKMGSSNVLMAELWGIFTALSIAWDNNLRKIWVESDSAVAVGLLKRGCPYTHPYAPMVKRIKDLGYHDW